MLEYSSGTFSNFDATTICGPAGPPISSLDADPNAEDLFSEALANWQRQKLWADCLASALRDYAEDLSNSLEPWERALALKSAEGMANCTTWIDIGAYREASSQRLRARTIDRVGCKSAFCPMCRSAAQYKRAEDVRQRAIAHLAGHRVFFGTLTIPATPAADALQNVVTTAAAFRKLAKRQDKNFSAWPVTGSIRFIESPWQSSSPEEVPTTNTHAHTIFLVPDAHAPKFNENFVATVWAGAIGTEWSQIDLKPVTGTALQIGSEVHHWALYGAKGPHKQGQYGADGYMNAPGQLPMAQSPEVFAHYAKLHGARLFQGSGSLHGKPDKVPKMASKLTARARFSWVLHEAKFRPAA